MRTFKLNLIILMVMLFNVTTTKAQLPPNDPVWELKFSDEFSGSILDTSKWAQIPNWNQSGNTETSNCADSPYDLAYRKWYVGSNTNKFFPDTTNCKLSSGTVKLYTRKENYTGEVWNWPGGVFTPNTISYKYTTSMLYSRYKFRYGYFEIRFRLPAAVTAPATHKGFGPNFWLYSENDIGTYSEIDVFEINALNNLYTTNVHFETDSNATQHIDLGALHGNLNANQWYTAAVNWTPDSIEFYRNGIKIRQYSADNRADSLIAMPIFVDINSPATNFCANFDTVNTVFPYVYEIDYVRVYQKKMACDTNKTYCNVDSTTYNSKVYNNLTIGGTSCTANISTANTSSLGANSVLLNEGFTIDSTTNAYIDVLECEEGQSFFKTVLPDTPLPPPPSFLLRMYYKSLTQ